MGLKSAAKRFAARLVGPGLSGIAERVGVLERIAARPLNAETPVWRGSFAEGRAVRSDGSTDEDTGAKYRDELRYWVIAKREPHKVDLDDFDRVFAEWQGIRLAELRDFVGAETDPEFEAWRHRQAVVEIGSGPYPCVAAATWRRAVAVDPLADGYAAENIPPRDAHMHRVAFVAAAGERLPLPGESADLVICENTLDHVTDPLQVMLEIRRVLRPGGLLWLLVDLMEYRDRMHPHSFGEPKLRALLDESGLQPVRERVDDHHSHPKAYGEYRALLAKPEGPIDLVRAPAERAHEPGPRVLTPPLADPVRD